MSDVQENQTPSILPDSPVQAIKALTDTVKDLIKVMDQEAHALATNDGVTLTSIEGEKERLAQRYDQMGQEFKARIKDFKTLDSLLIKQLETFQIELSEKTRNNMESIERLRNEKLIRGEVRVEEADPLEKDHPRDDA